MTHDPVLIAYAVKRSARTKRTLWSRIGHAYPHETGAGLTVILDALPADGRIILLEPDADDDARILRDAMKAGVAKAASHPEFLLCANLHLRRWSDRPALGHRSRSNSANACLHE
jgi:hypothetical protein